MQKVYTKRRESVCYTPRTEETQGDRMSVKFLFKMIIVALIICTVICIKRIDTDLYIEIRKSIDYVVNTNYTYTDILANVKESVEFFKQLIVM